MWLCLSLAGLSLLVALWVLTRLTLPAQIGKIKEALQDPTDDEHVELKLCWFYRPEEAVGGRKVGAAAALGQRCHYMVTWLIIHTTRTWPTH